MYYLDIHNHILPGVDDGSRDYNMSMAMLDYAYEEGIRALILTPHYHGGYVETGRETIDDTFWQLRNASMKRHPDLKLFLGNEIYYYPSVPEWIQNGTVHALADSNYVLLEFSNQVEKRSLMEAVQSMKSFGYYPVFAHVERYDCLYKDYDFIYELTRHGAYMQVNSRSITGEHGMKVKHFAKVLLKEEWIHFIGTDAHSMGERRPKMEECAEYILKKCRKEYASDILYANGVRLINNHPLK